MLLQLDDVDIKRESNDTVSLRGCHRDPPSERLNVVARGQWFSVQQVLHTTFVLSGLRRRPHLVARHHQPCRAVREHLIHHVRRRAATASKLCQQVASSNRAELPLQCRT